MRMYPRPFSRGANACSRVVTFDDRLAGIAGRHADVHHVALVFDPEPAVRRTADFLQDGFSARARRQPRAWRRLTRSRWRALQRHIAELAILLDGLEWLSVDEDHSRRRK
jgi:hypothetical protein